MSEINKDFDNQVQNLLQQIMEDKTTTTQNSKPFVPKSNLSEPFCYVQILKDDRKYSQNIVSSLDFKDITYYRLVPQLQLPSSSHTVRQIPLTEQPENNADYINYLKNSAKHTTKPSLSTEF